MPSSLADPGAATAYPWYGFTALVKAANTAKPQILQTRFTSKPMHYGAICNSGIGCTTDPTADRQMADFFGFAVAQDGGLRIVYNDTTNEFDGAGLFVTRQLGGSTVKATNIDVKPAADPVADVDGRRAVPALLAGSGSGRTSRSSTSRASRCRTRRRRRCGSR